MPWPSRTIWFYSPTRQSVYDSTFLGTCGFLLNTSKCHTVSIVGNGGLQKTVVGANRIFHIKGQPLRALSREDSWKYLGIEFSPEGRRPVRINNQLSPLLERLMKAALQPQQRIFALKTGAQWSEMVKKWTKISLHAENDYYGNCIVRIGSSYPKV